jgi:hypothetical protein
MAACARGHSRDQHLSPLTTASSLSTATASVKHVLKTVCGSCGRLDALNAVCGLTLRVGLDDIACRVVASNSHRAAGGNPRTLLRAWCVRPFREAWRPLPKPPPRGRRAVRV